MPQVTFKGSTTRCLPNHTRGHDEYFKVRRGKLSNAKLIDQSGRDIRLEVDGGIKTDNIRPVADAGADTFVAGSAIFGQSDYKTVIDAMRARLAA